MKISPRFCSPLNFAALGGCQFRLYGRAGPGSRTPGLMPTIIQKWTKTPFFVFQPSFSQELYAMNNFLAQIRVQRA